jgi:hypothetical protein
MGVAALRTKAERLRDALRPRLAKLDPDVPPLLLRQDQACEALGLSRAGFWELVQAGRIKKVLLPSGRGERPTVRYDYAELQRFVDGLKRKAK